MNFIDNSASNTGGAMKLFFRYSQLNAKRIVLENNKDSKGKAINQGRPSYYFLSFYDIISPTQLSILDSLEDLINDPDMTVIFFFWLEADANIKNRG